MWWRREERLPSPLDQSRLGKIQSYLQIPESGRRGLSSVVSMAQEETDGLRREGSTLRTSTPASLSQMIKWQWINLTKRE